MISGISYNIYAQHLFLVKKNKSIPSEKHTSFYRSVAYIYLPIVDRKREYSITATEKVKNKMFLLVLNTIFLQ